MLALDDQEMVIPGDELKPGLFLPCVSSSITIQTTNRITYKA
jgi:hypothetical protein